MTRLTWKMTPNPEKNSPKHLSEVITSEEGIIALYRPVNGYYAVAFSKNGDLSNLVKEACSDN